MNRKLFCLLSWASWVAVGAETERAGVSPLVPGVVIDHTAAATRQYVGSPSLVVLTNGTYLASHDFFGPGSTLDTTVVFASRDGGVTWARRAEVKGQWWSSLFVAGDAVYLIGTTRENGYAAIRRSRDDGRTWTTPTNASSGLLLADGRYHCAPVPVVAHAGRIWRAMEDTSGPGNWGGYFKAFMLSAPAGSDLLQASNWLTSTRLGRDPSWLGGKFNGWLEGNAVVTPTGQIVDILRVDSLDPVERAAVIHLSPDGRTATFNPDTGFIEFPGGAKKFTIRRDPISSEYWSLANFVPDRDRGYGPARTRNTLALIRSADLRHWTVRRVLLQHPDPERHGFQYVDWQFAGDDLLAVCRTAYDDEGGGAHNQHDANYLTFHRFAGFRHDDR